MVVRDDPAHRPRKLDTLCNETIGFISPFRNSVSFRWCFLVTVLYTSASSMPQYFIQYYLKDVVLVEFHSFSLFSHTVSTDPQEAAGYYFMFQLVVSTLSSLVGGSLSDRFGRLRVVCVGFTTAVASFVVLGAAPPNFLAAVGSSVLLGVATGLTQPALWAMTVDSLPDPVGNSGRDMAVYWLNTLPPQLLLPEVAGAMLAAFPKAERARGYICLWAFAAFFALVALACLSRISKPKSRHPQPLD